MVFFIKTKAMLSVLAGTVIGACGMFAVSSETEAQLSDVVVENNIETEISTPVIEPTVHAGVDETRTINVGGVDRTYRIHVPDGKLHVGGVVPVVFVAHYYHGTAEKMQKVTGFNDVEAVIVYLQGVDNAWAPAPYAKTSSEEDLAYFDAVRKEISRDFPVSRGNTFIVGFSNGGGFAMHVRCNRPSVVGGVATVSAAFYDDVLQGCAAMPVKHVDIHGDNDPILSYDGGIRYGHSYWGVDDVMREVAGFNSCIAYVDESVHVGRVRRWNSCVADLKQIKIVGGGHDWGVVSKNDSSPSFATREIVEFFGLGFVV